MDAVLARSFWSLRRNSGQKAVQPSGRELNTGMLSPTAAAGPDQFRHDRLERLLALVTEHERCYREQVCVPCWWAVGRPLCSAHQSKLSANFPCLCQDIRLAGLSQKVTDLEVRSASEWAPLLPLKV